MGNWPGAAADDWWDGLPVARKEQIHRWVTQRRHSDDLPDEQLELLDVAGEPEVAGTGR